MTTTEGNKIIAEFMGAIKQRDNIYWFSITPTPDSSYGWNDFAMQYHSSWDWLMPVVQKIGEIDSEWLADNRNEFIEPLMCASIFTSIKSVWDYVVLFIQWYNENKIK